MSETFKLKLVKQEPRKLKQAVCLLNVLDGAIYKGAYLTTAELLTVEAAEHDYADNFETNTRWTHTLYEWVDTGTQIPDDARYVQLKDESIAATPDTVVIRDDNGEIHTAEPTSDDSAATKSYVDAEQTRAESAEQTLQESIDAETQRATTHENALAALIAEETTNRQTADDTLTAQIEAAKQTLQANIDAETQRATISENALAESIAKETTDRQDADNALTAQIEAETTRAKNAESALQATIEATGSQLDQLIIDETKRAQNAEGILADAIDEEIARAKAAEQTKIDKTLTNSIVESVEYTYDNATDASALSVKSINPSTNTETTTDVQLIKANENQSGLMSKENVTLLSQLNTRVASLEGKQYLYLYTASANPTADDINTFVLAQGGVSPFSGVEVLVEQTKHVWRYYENDNIGWRDDGIDTVQQATQTELGVVKGSATNGKVYVESDGTMSVMGYDALVESDSQNAQAIANETTARQDADTTLQTSINAEKTRAQNAENALNVALSQEISNREDADTTINASLNSHIANVNNPHSVTKAQVGLSDVQNVDTTNADNISTGTLNALRLAATLLNAGENVTISRNAETGEFTISATFTAPVTSVNGQTGDVTIDTSTDPESVHFTAQTLSDSQQTQARENIGAASVAEMNVGDDKSFYNLGAYDTYVDNGDGTVTVTRNRDGVTYPETLPADVPLNQLDQNMTDIVRDEVEKTLNLFDGVWEQGTFDADGGEVYITYRVRSTKMRLDAGTYSISLSGADDIDIFIFNDDGTLKDETDWLEGDTFTLSESGIISIACRKSDNSDISPEDIQNTMLVKGSHAYSYQPYNGAIVHEKQLPRSSNFPFTSFLDFQIYDKNFIVFPTVDGKKVAIFEFRLLGNHTITSGTQILSHSMKLTRIHRTMGSMNYNGFSGRVPVLFDLDVDGTVKIYVLSGDNSQSGSWNCTEIFTENMIITLDEGESF